MGKFSHDPIEEALDVEISKNEGDNDNGDMEFVNQVEPTTAWNQMRDD